jgi:acetylornithine deacetylase/succinyl-diaminopimelate desuccinylase-like protein
VSDEPAELVRMREWLEDRFRELGATVRRIEHPGSPDFLLARLGGRDPAVLYYNHYDVQPADRSEGWRTPPFEPRVEDGFVFARGVADNKGTLVARLAAAEVYQTLFGDLPLTLKFLVEGEEETGSKALEAVVAAHAADLQATGCMWEGTGIDHAGRPKLVFGAKGLLCVELDVKLLNDDQHSSLGVYAPSAAWRLVEALSTLRSDDGRVLIDGFYDGVPEPSAEDLELLGSLVFDEAAELERLGVASFVGGRSGLDFLRSYYFSPSCNIAGLSAGWTGQGTYKTVLPGSARANVDFRLVPGQSPEDVLEKLRAHLRAHGFGDVVVTSVASMRPLRSPVDSEIGRTAIAAARQVFPHEPVVQPLMIGAGPLHPVATILGIPIVSPPGVNRPSSNVHAANENCRIGDFLKIVEHNVVWMRAYETRR